MTRPPRAPFDWPLFLKGLPLQPVPAWLAFSLLCEPAARATPRLLGATCGGRMRETVANAAFLVYANALPASAAALIYLLAGRRRIVFPPHRRVADACLALVLLVSAANAAMTARRVRENWAVLRPGLAALRAACWN